MNRHRGPEHGWSRSSSRHRRIAAPEEISSPAQYGLRVRHDRKHRAAAPARTPEFPVTWESPPPTRPEPTARLPGALPYLHRFENKDKKASSGRGRAGRAAGRAPGGAAAPGAGPPAAAPPERGP